MTDALHQTLENLTRDSLISLLNSCAGEELELKSKIIETWEARELAQKLSTQRSLITTRGHRNEEGDWAGGLHAFVQYFWHVLEPETPLVLGWTLEAVCEHLEAVTFGEIRKLLINVPPGFMKSLLTDVFWPAWEWAIGKSHLRYVTFSYSASLTERDNIRFESLLSSSEFKELFPELQLVHKGATFVSNTRKGWKRSSSIGGVGTGERGDRIILDDPHNVKESESEIVRTETTRWFRESMTSRLNDMQRGAVVIIMQRVHEDDVSGVILSNQFDYVHLMIPMEYDPSRQADAAGEPVATSIGWFDPRWDKDLNECEGVLAWPERFPAETCVEMKKEAGDYAWAGQYQQSPAPRGGGLFKTDWWQVYEPKDGKFPPFDLIIASVDSAFTAKETNDPTGMTVWGIFLHDISEGRGQVFRRRLMLIDAWRKHLEFSGPRDLIERKSNETYNVWVRRTQEHWGLIEWIQHTCTRTKVDKLLIEGKASGISAAQELRNRYGLQRWTTQLCPVKGDKYARAVGVQATFANGMVFAPVRDWSDIVINEMALFPNGKYDDLTDSTTQAINWLRVNGLAPTDQETTFTEMEAVTHRSRAGRRELHYA